VRFVAALLDPVHNVIDLRIGCFARHVENHFRVLADC
jgi:hypothetical protein